MKIDEIKIKIIPDSKGKDTLEAEMRSQDVSVSASVPAGESTGKNEAKLINPHKAAQKTNWVFSQIKDTEFATLDQFDGMLNTLDGTADKSNLGANFILSLSLAFTKLLAKQAGIETWQLISKISGAKPALPLCLFNLIEGGVHTSNSLPFQEYWFIPKSTSAKASLETCFNLLDTLKEKIQKQYGQVEMGSEGGYTIPSKDPLVGLQILQQAMVDIREDAYLGLDVAASTFFKNGKYQVGEKLFDQNQLLQVYQNIINSFPMLAIEDPYAEEDWPGFIEVTQKLGEKVWIVADDLTTTSTKVIKMATEREAANSVIIKTTQIGTVSETIQAANLAKNYGWKTIVANRGEETMDDFIADLAVGVGADGLKSGCPLQKERLVKYERLMEIEAVL